MALDDGSEEIEAVTPIDLLKRAGADLIIASPKGGTVHLAHGVKMISEISFDELEEESFGMIILPGGLPGAYNLRDSESLDRILRKHMAKALPVAAICASPAFVLAHKGLIKGYLATAYPGCEEGYFDVKWQIGKKVVVDRNLITANGPGAAYPFALEIIKTVFSPELRQRLSQDTMFE